MVLIQLKLMELINKNYVLKTKETISLHRDMTMKNIEINHLVEKLIGSIRLMLRDNVSQENRRRSPLKPLVPVLKDSDQGDWTYSRENSAPKLAKMRFETRMKKQNTDSQDLFRNKSASVKRKSSYTEENEDPNSENEFSSKLQVTMANISVAVKRGGGLANEYKKIDENLHKLVKFLASKDKSTLLPRYAAMLERSDIGVLVEKNKSLRLQEEKCKKEILQKLEDTYDKLRSQVNSMKNQTKERRDVLIMMVRNDKLTVENVHSSPKKA